jgi:hypothetical protein
MAWLENYGWRPMSRTPMSGALCLDRYNKLVWRPMVSDTVYVQIQGLLTRQLLTMRQLELSARDL